MEHSVLKYALTAARDHAGGARRAGAPETEPVHAREGGAEGGGLACRLLARQGG